MSKDIFYRDSIDHTINEDCMEFIEDPNNIGVSILVGGVTKNNEPYALFVNGLLADHNGCGKDTEKEGKRISLSDLRYLQYDSLFTEEEKNIFAKVLKENWNGVKETYNWIYGQDNNIIIPDQCPDYVSLESEN